MRISSYTQIQQVYNSTQTAKASKARGKGFSDAVSISSTGKDMQIAKNAVAVAPDIRTELTDRIKAQVDTGAYDVSGESFADKLLEKMNQGGYAL